MHTILDTFCLTDWEGAPGCFSTVKLFENRGDLDPVYECFAVERPWLDNRRSVSCVPGGEYELVPHLFRGQLQTFAIVGKTVSHWKSSKTRYACVFPHVANSARHVNGCAGYGDSLGALAGGEWAVMNSARTVNEYLRIIRSRGDEGHTLTILGR